MKRTFPVIIVLISLSLIGIIVIQISWLNNMLVLREDQVKDKVQYTTQLIAEELSQYRGMPSNNKILPGFGDEFSYELSKPYNVGNRFTAQELYEMIKKGFIKQELEHIPFEFGLAGSGSISYMERKSTNFENWMNDTIGHKSYAWPLSTPSGSPGESLASEEVLIIVVPQIKDIVTKSLIPRMVFSLLLIGFIITAFYLTIRTMWRQKKVSEIKNDFINNMTHEFKTPLATISLAVDALKNEKVTSDPAKLSYFSGIIKEENQRMNRQVETILKSALMDRQEV
ncbi:MAG TPA: histidine kinase dimerization/phospho-acceptor domain-containing protein, partial [Chitinophagaceae bacterium]|nr:histidine kinase dimerization/phospho-acceptor domain-containing protein [Chitinophagaceae bacterium]